MDSRQMKASFHIYPYGRCKTCHAEEIMRKTAMMFLAFLMTFLTAVCGGSSDGGKTDGGKADLGSYPENLDEWSGQNFID